MVPPYIGHTLSKVWVICVLVSQVFVFFGVFSTELLTLPSKITEVGRLSLFIEFFVGFHIVCDRYTQDNAHFTYFNTILPLSLSSGLGSEVYPWSESSSNVHFLESVLDIHCQQLEKMRQLEGVCAQFGRRVPEGTFSRICIKHTLPTIAECWSVGGCLTTVLFTPCYSTKPSYCAIREGVKKNGKKAVRLTAWVDPPPPPPFPPQAVG